MLDVKVLGDGTLEVLAMALTKLVMGAEGDVMTGYELGVASGLYELVMEEVERRDAERE